ncbi:hypothetical protein AVEN_197316-1 [Araneus ventricosus]|uniref:Uncharacterized protein n=1 Tax=Araneus ventricosus TaxID=182803 RepID=A0A4Y2EWI8_ARAVE|nr:hypothetical protein AVEN_197316-1 [Araneus ventricosus]
MFVKDDMKPSDFKYGRKEETDDEKEENAIFMAESEVEDFGSFQQEMEAAEMVEVIHLESIIADFSTNTFVLIDNDGGARMKTHYSYVCGVQGVDGEFDTTGLRTTNMATLKFVSVMNAQFDISESQENYTPRSYL